MAALGRERSASKGREPGSTESKRAFDDETYNSVVVHGAIRSDSFLDNVEQADGLKDLCLLHVPFWDDLTRRDIDLKLITISLTNKVYMVKLVKPETGSRRHNKVLLRMIHEEKAVLYDINHQNEVAIMSGNYGFCPKVLSTFAGGRIEEWLEGFVLDSHALFNISLLTTVAALIARFHRTITALAPAGWDRTPSLLNKVEEWRPKCHEINARLKLGMDVGAMDALFRDYVEYLHRYLATVRMPEYPDLTRPGEKAGTPREPATNGGQRRAARRDGRKLPAPRALLPQRPPHQELHRHLRRAHAHRLRVQLVQLRRLRHRLLLRRRQLRLHRGALSDQPRQRAAVRAQEHVRERLPLGVARRQRAAHAARNHRALPQQRRALHRRDAHLLGVLGNHHVGRAQVQGFAERDQRDV